MGTYSNVVWTSGAISPQHFQQQQRYYDYVFSHQLNALTRFFMGLRTSKSTGNYYGLGVSVFQPHPG
ncbi:hypothetical protein [Phytobacter massiliensis]|uniref:hypothetical protein n=1 Tax=Phytobacter massiliensis TaxID=1485952 RepID=UPI0002F5DC6F|nr:hypothetical protein [Phytobacter massiliensis]